MISLHAKFTTFLIALVAFLSGCSSSTVVDFKDPNIRYIGRYSMEQNGAVLTWTGASVYLNFNGTGASAMLTDSKGHDLITVVVDGKVVKTLLPSRNRIREYELVDDLPAGPHTLQLFKRTEFSHGKLSFYHFKLYDNGTALQPPTFKHSIEFYGNSITCGYALEDTEKKERGEFTFENGYRSYANLTARHFNAAYSCVAKSGIGLTVSWFPYIMPEIYDLKDPTEPGELWDFKKFTPEIVVVNMFQNDYHLVNYVTHKEFKARFGNTPPTPEFIIKKYQEFIGSLRSKYPGAKIICTLGSMDVSEAASPFPAYVDKAVKSMGDKNMYTLIFPYIGERRHPNAAEHEAMAKQLTGFIEQKFGWKREMTTF